jgi:anaerobic selenocysteine-containing dehydrogenase
MRAIGTLAALGIVVKIVTVGDYWLQAAYPENFVEVAAADAKRLGLKDGELVRVVSASNPEGVWKLGNGRTRHVVGKVRVREGLRPGVVAFSLCNGHWAYGAGEWIIDGQAVPGDPRRATGIHANAAMRLDPVLKNTGWWTPPAAAPSSTRALSSR